MKRGADCAKIDLKKHHGTTDRTVSFPPLFLKCESLFKIYFASQGEVCMIDYETLKNSDAAVVFIGGQSNAHAHMQAMDPADRVTEPMKNVFKLDATRNQSFDTTDAFWSGFTTQDYNLGEVQDDTYSFAYYLATKWQRAKDEGKPLPDLYIVQISIGSQGILNGLWNKDIQPVIVPGPIGVCWVSLYWLALHVNPLVIQNLKAHFKHPTVLGWHWIGSDQDVVHGGYDHPDFHTRYDEFFDTMLPTMDNPPLYLYKPVYYKLAEDHEAFRMEGIHGVTDELRRQMTRYPKSELVEVDKDCPNWDPTDELSGVFSPDNIHYRKETQEWLADHFFRGVLRDWKLL